MNNLDPNKAHGHYMPSIWMIKLRRNSICKPLSIIWNDFLKERKISSDWKKAHDVPVYNKRDKQYLKDCWPICLFPICSKVSERLIYNKLFTFFTDNNLICPNHSGFRHGESCVNQLIAITRKIYKAWKIWSEGSLLRYIKDKLKYGINVYISKCCLWKAFKTFMRLFILSQATSSSKLTKFIRENFNAGFPQGSI